MKYQHTIHAGNARATFDTADEALKFAAQYAHMTNRTYHLAKATLRSGNDFNYAYGYSTVKIITSKKEDMP